MSYLKITYEQLEKIVTAIKRKISEHTHDVVSTTAAGFAPKRDGSNTKYLRADGTWAVPPDTKVTVDSTLNAGSNNPVRNSVVTSALNDKLPKKGDLDLPDFEISTIDEDGNATSIKMLSDTITMRADSSIDVSDIKFSGSIDSTNKAYATQTKAGLMSTTDKKKLDGIGACVPIYYGKITQNNNAITAAVTSIDGKVPSVTSGALPPKGIYLLQSHSISSGGNITFSFGGTACKAVRVTYNNGEDLNFSYFDGTPLMPFLYVGNTYDNNNILEYIGMETSSNT